MLKKITSIAAAAAVLAAALPVNAVNSFADEGLVDSGINYTESVETIQNPGAGYTSTVWANCSPGNTKVYSPTGSLALFFIDIGQFSSGVNGTTDEDGNYTAGTDYDLDETFFNAWEQTFENCRRNGCMVGVRFRYDANGKDNPEPETFDKVLDHIRQVKESGILERNSDILAFVESGFVGKWGEQHGGKYTDVAHKAQLLDAMLDAVPESVPVTVRTPDIFAEWAGIKRSQLDDEELYSGENEKLLSKRVGLYNDGYMGSNSDLGTFSNREIETNWLHRVTEETYYGGEFSGNIDYAKKYETYLPQNAIPEMYKTRLSYINGNIFQLYKDYTFGGEYDVENVDNSAYYGQTVYQFIRDHLGYRFVLRNSEHSAKVEQGGELETVFSVENTGFANAVFHPQSYLILEKDGKFYEAEMPADVHDWKSCTVSENSFKWHLPDNIEPGEWNIYVRSAAVADNCIDGGLNDELSVPKYGIRFANEGVWNSQLGANYLGSFEITESSVHGTDCSLYETETKTGADTLSVPLTLSGLTVVDGMKSHADEWQGSDKIAEKDGNTISIKADDKNLYVMAELPEGAKSPVYNIQIKNGGENYWLYYASNGFIYFNHQSYAGCQCKWSGNIVEFKIPFDVMELKSGLEMTSVRVFLQDSGNEWKVMGDLTANSVEVPSDFLVYSAEYDLYMLKDSAQEISVRCPVENVAYQWYHEGEPIEGAVESVYTVKNDSDSSWGNYSVRITSDSGVEKTVSIANVKEVSADVSQVRGDSNCDGKVDISDAVMILQAVSNPDKYGVGGTDKTCITEQGMLNGDVAGGRNGITAADALEIQRYVVGLITEFESDLTDQ